MKIDIQKIESGEDQVIIRYREKNRKIQRILDALGDEGTKLFGKKDGETVPVSPGSILYIESVDD